MIDRIEFRSCGQSFSGEPESILVPIGHESNGHHSTTAIRLSDAVYTRKSDDVVLALCVRRLPESSRLRVESLDTCLDSHFGTDLLARTGVDHSVDLLLKIGLQDQAGLPV